MGNSAPNTRVNVSDSCNDCHCNWHCPCFCLCGNRGVATSVADAQQTPRAALQDTQPTALEPAQSAAESEGDGSQTAQTSSSSSEPSVELGENERLADEGCEDAPEPEDEVRGGLLLQIVAAAKTAVKQIVIGVVYGTSPPLSPDNKNKTTFFP